VPLSRGTYDSARRLPPTVPYDFMSGYSYGHAERTLATIRLLEAETRELLCREEQLDSEQAEWLREAADSASRRLRSGSADGHARGPAGVR
jgi:hypothetical protein